MTLAGPGGGRTGFFFPRWAATTRTAATPTITAAATITIQRRFDAAGLRSATTVPGGVPFTLARVSRMSLSSDA